MAWLRLYTDVAHDPKVQRLSPALFKFWITILCLAKENNGVVPSVSDVSFVSHRRPKRTRTELQLLTEAGLLDATSDGLVPHNWSGRQYKSDDVTARVQRFRERSSNVSETPPETETETEQSSDPSDRVLPAPSACRDRFFRAEKPNDPTAAVIDFWRVPLSGGQRGHLGKLLKRVGHGQRVWDAVKASTDAADPVQLMERLLNDGKRDAGRAKKESTASPFEGFGRTATSGGEAAGEGAR